MTIHHKRRPVVLSDRESKRRIAAVVHANPAIESSIDDLIVHDPKGTLTAKRNRAIFAVYIKNEVFEDAVDAELAKP